LRKIFWKEKKERGGEKVFRRPESGEKGKTALGGKSRKGSEDNRRGKRGKTECRKPGPKNEFSRKEGAPQEKREPSHSPMWKKEGNNTKGGKK